MELIRTSLEFGILNQFGHSLILVFLLFCKKLCMIFFHNPIFRFNIDHASKKVQSNMADLFRSSEGPDERADDE